ncbi:hypothetical protein H6G81_23470 [Scytonema hofmannii FACHB-248]|uniref:Uncharacterized protein n=1 Tax=Scytonema hofmannii FACHB-248 TaxID=1842502 RepID=A0ABR8GW62_9CYAN|nr:MULTISPECIES: hypothetical protein [Nostocales]MBD2607403.1 hypothetical protein [Scytonema hofmannii FACHB-248]
MVLLTEHQLNSTVDKSSKNQSKQASERKSSPDAAFKKLYIPALVKALRELGFSCCGQINFYRLQQAWKTQASNCVNLLTFHKLSDFWLHNDSNFRSLTESDNFFTHL